MDNTAIVRGKYTLFILKERPETGVNRYSIVSNGPIAYLDTTPGTAINIVNVLNASGKDVYVEDFVLPITCVCNHVDPSECNAVAEGLCHCPCHNRFVGYYGFNRKGDVRP